jgi:anti-anti-sigma factor
MADPGYPIVMIGGVPVVEAPPEIDAANAELFRKALLQAASSGHATVVNLTGTQLCDSAGVAALAWAHGLAVAKGHEFLLVVPAEAAVLRVFTLAGIDRLIPRFTDLRKALEQVHAVLPRPLTESPAEAGLPDL